MSSGRPLLVSLALILRLSRCSLFPAPPRAEQTNGQLPSTMRTDESNGNAAPPVVSTACFFNSRIQSPLQRDYSLNPCHPNGPSKVTDLASCKANLSAEMSTTAHAKFKLHSVVFAYIQPTRHNGVASHDSDPVSFSSLLRTLSLVSLLIAPFSHPIASTVS